MKDDSIVYLICNLSVMAALTALCGIAIFHKIDSWTIRIILCIGAFIACAYFEQWVVSKYVNELVEFILKLFGSDKHNKG